MKLDKAIELSAKDPRELTHFEIPDYLTAVKLGIEALKLVKRFKPYGYAHPRDLLPGEDPPEPKTIPIETLVKIRESPLGREPKV